MKNFTDIPTPFCIFLNVAVSTGELLCFESEPKERLEHVLSQSSSVV